MPNDPRLPAAPEAETGMEPALPGSIAPPDEITVITPVDGERSAAFLFGRPLVATRGHTAAERRKRPGWRIFVKTATAAELLRKLRDVGPDTEPYETPLPPDLLEAFQVLGFPERSFADLPRGWAWKSAGEHCKPLADRIEAALRREMPGFVDQRPAVEQV